MNISANSCSPDSQQVTIHKQYSIEDAERIMALTKQLNDSFSKGDEENPEQKSPLGTCASALGAVLATFVIGKCAASKIMTAFPSIPSKLEAGLRKNANFIRNYADDVANAIKLKKGGKYTKFAGEKVRQAEKLAREQFIKTRGKVGTEGVLSNIVGAASIVSVAPEILSVDGNNDGIADITQRNVNAYKNAAKNIGIISEVVNALA